MLSKQKIERINELAKRAKTTGLTDGELREQKKLREEYIQQFRQSFKNQLHSVTVVDGAGNDVTPDKLKQSKNKYRNDIH
ncbi:DUF896 domain-containing protein [Halalkalibacterium halodurans]|jgi:uncharacterized protein YnzC (UPF0291/DUF896 family)|uniref:UPF0291 protein AMD02_08210 n=1 Tax=Halalkalibacterium halodurans TaxID=86665 RepID=A0A0M0KJ04_ALKHA|nr:DUF896 domain-containing protein [Halalkalibacterium halodurans]MDY7222902.1 DUF896 domain-containing protein [Halalkalibacterium halodurans]MDY7242123.1 DUF896 domain-containing protein [Halalkalibacterium halodurans]MED3648496.1 DUF896 domain-containing protein [Halalkalibacterium halodurans]MED4081182.1 DUF896 domain-containing protein [Halalkalibacterium halodurans]MED4087017.1 DUF896 domain-containing protein [Halalkalibacterium halodurans]